MSDTLYEENRSRAKKNAVSERNIEDELVSLRKENQNLLDAFDEIAARANTTAVEAEIARFEFEQVFDAVGDPLWVVDNQNIILRINKSFTNLLNFRNKEAAIGKKCYEILDSPMCRTKNCPLERIKNGSRRVEFDIELRMTNGNSNLFWLTGTPLFGLTNEIIGAVEHFKEITKRKHQEEALKIANIKLEKLAVTDGLTQLANRRVFDETLEKEWRRMRRDQQPLSVVMGDIDFFKYYNDFYGHQKGDACLKAVAECIKNSVHRSADIVARYGGEEFVALLPNTPSDGAYRVAETIRTAVSSMNLEHARSEVKKHVTISLGIATITPHMNNQTPQDLVKFADDALYESKKAGRNLVTVRISTE